MSTGCLKNEPAEVEGVNVGGLARQYLIADDLRLLQLPPLMMPVCLSHQVGNRYRLTVLGQGGRYGESGLLSIGASCFSIHGNGVLTSLRGALATKQSGKRRRALDCFACARNDRGCVAFGDEFGDAAQ